MEDKIEINKLPGVFHLVFLESSTFPPAYKGGRLKGGQKHKMVTLVSGKIS